MIVECPHCSTRYKLDATRVAADAMLRCSRCHHVFPAPGAKKPAPAPGTARQTPPPAGQNLSLPFDEPGWTDAEADDPAAELTVPEPDEHYTLGTSPASPETAAGDLELPPEEDDEMDVTLPAHSEVTEAPVRPRAATPQTPRRAAPAPAFSSADSFDGPHDEDDATGGGGRTRKGRRRPPAGSAGGETGERGMLQALFVFLGLVLAGYGLLTRTMFTSPEFTDRLLERVPFMGVVSNERLFNRKVALLDVSGAHQQLRDGKPVFVITGRAVNTAPVPLHGVQIAGKLLDNHGQELDRKVIYCGNAISAKLLKDLTRPEVSILQSVNPPKQFSIEPGAASTFVIVFMDPPRAAVEFTTQVAAAQRHA